jgi:cytochrome b561
MGLKNTVDRYGTLSIVMHWLMFLLLVAVYSCIELREIYPKGSDPREALKQWHFMLGLSVFMLVWLRLALRFWGQTPQTRPAPGIWQHRAAVSMHFALYLFMLAMPIMGWLILSAEGKSIPFFGLELPALIGENEGFAEQVEDIHKTVGTVGYYLVGLHATAALFHHYFMRDNTLLRMLPQRRKKDQS